MIGGEGPISYLKEATEDIVVLQNPDELEALAEAARNLGIVPPAPLKFQDLIEGWRPIKY